MDYKYVKAISVKYSKRNMNIFDFLYKKQISLAKIFKSINIMINHLNDSFYVFFTITLK